MAKKSTNSAPKVADTNMVGLSGVVKRVIKKSDKMIMFSLCVTDITPNDKEYNNYITVKAFPGEGIDWADSFACVEEGDRIGIDGKLQVEEYKGNYSTNVIAFGVDFKD